MITKDDRPMKKRIFSIMIFLISLAFMGVNVHISYMDNMGMTQYDGPAKIEFGDVIIDWMGFELFDIENIRIYPFSGTIIEGIPLVIKLALILFVIAPKILMPIKRRISKRYSAEGADPE